MDCSGRKLNRQWQWQNRPDLRWRRFLFFLALTRMSCSCGAPPSITECSKQAPYFLTANQRIILCGKANTSAPADCARKAHGALGLSGPHILELCSGTSSEQPGACVARLSRSTAKALSPGLRVELCKDAISEGPAQCAEHSINSKRQPQLVVDVCKGASSTAPAECLDLLPQAFPYEATVNLCSRAQTVGPAICAKFRGQLSHEPDLTAKLCQDASGQGPAECFRRSALATTLSVDDRVELCTSSKSDAPARCAGSMRDRHLSPSDKVKLCRGTSSSAPAACLASAPPTVAIGDRVALCVGATEPNPTAPAICLKAVPQDLSLSFAVALCRGASDSMAAECAKVARHSVGDVNGILVLCRHASSTAPAHCAKAAVRVGVEKTLTAILCTGSDSSAPASCFAAAPHQIPAELIVETCTGAQSTSPALCLAAAMPRNIRAKSEGAVCPLDPGAGTLTREGLDYYLAVRLCRDSPDNSPAQCGHEAPFRMSDGDVEVLCEAKGLPTGQATAKCAVAALMIGISSTNAASLCRGARSDAPAACAATAAPHMGEEGRVALCVGASSDAPARCANWLSVTRFLSAVELAKCKAAVPSASGLHITKLAHDGKRLVADQPMQATLEVWDQWGSLIPSDTSTVVRASIAVRGSNGAFVNPAGRFNTSNNGLIFFSHLSFSGPGSLTLQFSIDRGDGDKVPLAAAQVIVTETEHGAIVKRCGSIFRQLTCPSEKGERKAPEGVDERRKSVSTEAVSSVSGGVAGVWRVLTCQKILENNGVHVAYLSGGTGLFSARLWYHPGIEVLETGAGLPNREQPSWDRLGVRQNAHSREVRRAYYRQSLLWHPDRWVRHSMHSARAQEVFEIVSEAYAWIVQEGNNIRLQENSTSPQSNSKGVHR